MIKLLFVFLFFPFIAFSQDYPMIWEIDWQDMERTESWNRIENNYKFEGCISVITLDAKMADLQSYLLQNGVSVRDVDLNSPFEIGNYLINHEDQYLPIIENLKTWISESGESPDSIFNQLEGSFFHNPNILFSYHVRQIIKNYDKLNRQSWFEKYLTQDGFINIFSNIEVLFNHPVIENEVDGCQRVEPFEYGLTHSCCYHVLEYSNKSRSFRRTVPNYRNIEADHDLINIFLDWYNLIYVFPGVMHVRYVNLMEHMQAVPQECIGLPGSSPLNSEDEFQGQISAMLSYEPYLDTLEDHMNNGVLRSDENVIAEAREMIRAVEELDEILAQEVFNYEVDVCKEAFGFLREENGI